jgi:hypothetical protein
LRELDRLETGHRAVVLERIENAIGVFKLDTEDNANTYACPLYEKDAGCLVHATAKPLPCIHHACYERREDLPPDALLLDAELAVELLNRKTYGRTDAIRPLPVAIRNSGFRER